MKANDIVELKRIRHPAGLNEDSSDISVDGLLSFIKTISAALESRNVEQLENMKNEMDSVFSDNGNSLVQTKRYLIDNAVAIIGDLRSAERGGY